MFKEVSSSIKKEMKLVRVFGYFFGCHFLPVLLSVTFINFFMGGGGVRLFPLTNFDPLIGEITLFLPASPKVKAGVGVGSLRPSVCPSVRPSQNLVIATPLKLLIQLS